MAAQNMPPAIPAIKTAAMIQLPVWLSAIKATPEAVTAPITNCPSAPMFHTLERKHTAKPKAMMSKGVALTISSDRAYGVLIGSQKKTCKPRTGSLPSALNNNTPMTMVMSTAKIGEAMPHTAEGWGRASRRNMGRFFR